MIHTDICIAGAGIIGLSIALELAGRGLSVTVVEAGEPMREASTAAAGMLAADDPHNPLELAELSRLSRDLYPAFLGRITRLSSVAVPFQTERTLQKTGNAASQALDAGLLEALTGPTARLDVLAVPNGFEVFRERSIDPRQLAPALLAAVQATSIRLAEKVSVVTTRTLDGAVQVETSTGVIRAGHFIDCTGAWAKDAAYNALPIKGQMLAVELPGNFPLRTTVRTKHIYVVPRTLGVNAGRAIIGATVEDAGFDKLVHEDQIEWLRSQAVAMLPPLGGAPVIEAWAGLRPGTADGLPLIGPHPEKANHWVAAGHYRNGILLAPATAYILGELVAGRVPGVSLAAFSASRISMRGQLISHK